MIPGLYVYNNNTCWCYVMIYRLLCGFQLHTSVISCLQYAHLFMYLMVYIVYKLYARNLLVNLSRCFRRYLYMCMCSTSHCINGEASYEPLQKKNILCIVFYGNNWEMVRYIIYWFYHNSNMTLPYIAALFSCQSFSLGVYLSWCIMFSHVIYLQFGVIYHIMSM